MSIIIVKRIPFYRISWKATGRAQTRLRSRIGTKIGTGTGTGSRIGTGIGTVAVNVAGWDQNLAATGGVAAERGP